MPFFSLQRERSRVDGHVDVDGMGRRLEAAWKGASAATKSEYARNMHGFVRCGPIDHSAHYEKPACSVLPILSSACPLPVWCRHEGLAE